MVFRSTAERAFRRFSLRVLKKITMIAKITLHSPPKELDEIQFTVKFQ
jgi:hypothetical protein